MTSAKLALACGSIAFCLSALGAASEVGVWLVSAVIACVLAVGFFLRKHLFNGKNHG